MDDKSLYAAILGVKDPWGVKTVELRLADGEVHIWVALPTETLWVCPECLAAAPIHDHRERIWRHLDTCQYRTLVHAHVPRLNCPSHGIRQVRVPWAEEKSRFTPDSTRRLDKRASAGLIEQLRAIEESRRNGVLLLPDGDSLNVSNLHKIFWPKLKLTKGDLLRYYARVAPCILPAVADRPLVMKRFPNGIGGPPFYQHRVQDVPPGVRVETVQVVEKRPQLVGGTVKTLLYMAQLAAISQDPWFSRVGSIEYADYVALDLDPAEGVPFSQVLDVAQWIHDELGAEGVPKTSGAEGLHVYIPLPRETPYEAGLLLCQIVATVVASKHPKAATVERAVRSRGRRVYIDYLQNIPGKTLATAYSARASEYAGVSTPLTWDEIRRGVKRDDFTINTVPERLERVGDLWKTLRASKGINLAAVEKYARRVKGA